MGEESVFRYQIATLGCRVNQYESESIAAELQLNGGTPADQPDGVNLFIINTCTVTAKAAMQSRQAVRHLIRENPNAVVLVTGCYAQSEPGIFMEMPGVDYVIGNSDKHHIHRIIGDTPQKPENRPQRACSPIIRHTEFKQTRLPIAGCRARPYLKIQDGCEDFCSYCIVPYTRGPSRSLPTEAVFKMLGQLKTNGAKEAVLTGIHIGRYGHDLTPQTSLDELLKQIDAADAIDRIRLSSIEPGELTDGIIHMAAANRRICRHFHIPLQSGDAAILEKMKRPYTPDFFKKLVLSIHDRIKDAAIGVDVLVGFPGEDEKAFNNTYDLLASLPITYLHVFPFSPRRGTPAARYPDPVDPQILKARCALLRQLSRKKRAEFYERQIGQVVDVILEDKPDPSSGRFKGISANYISVYTAAPDAYKNSLVSCRLVSPAPPLGVIGEIVV